MRAVQYYVLKGGRIINAVMTAERDRSKIAQSFAGDVVIKTESECTQAQLEAYEFWSTRP